MSNELFFDINEQQQEAVAGGNSYDYGYPSYESIYDSIYTSLDEYKKSAVLEFDVASTRDGSAVSQKFAFDKSDFSTYANKYFQFY